MFNHKIPENLIEHLTKGPTAIKTTEVAKLQNYIQDLLNGTHHTFLQGSYKNDTAITDINDVDIVAVRKTVYSGTYSPYRQPTSVTWDSIFSEIEQVLSSQSRYNWDIKRGDKCIKISGAFDADVVPAVKIEHDETSDPIVVYSFREDVEKVNNPRVHYENGVLKSKSTSDNYKPTVRLLKNWVKNHFGGNDVVSSFKMEALVHGVDNDKFFDDYPLAFHAVGSSIVDKLSIRNLIPVKIFSVCGGEDIMENWNISDRNIFVSTLNKSVNDALLAYKTDNRAIAENKWRETFNL